MIQNEFKRTNKELYISIIVSVTEEIKKKKQDKKQLLVQFQCQSINQYV